MIDPGPFVARIDAEFGPEVGTRVGAGLVQMIEMCERSGPAFAVDELGVGPVIASALLATQCLIEAQKLGDGAIAAELRRVADLAAVDACVLAGWQPPGATESA